ncbi:MAG TPA: MerR family transcriptional regulator [Streptosporangiaceae bacterium]|nr:MerR family transcriptional regulator [Streptosporangiaceae bacterium]
MEKLLTIGEFSRVCGLSARVLRSYAGTGLLPPVAVDRWTGYRYYTPGQVQRATVIGLLRQAGMPLRDIAGILADPDPGRLDEWEHSLGQELASRRQALAAARRELPALPPGPPLPAARPASHPVAGLTAGAASVRGPARAANQDAVLADGDLFAVADGVGSAGRAASLLAVEVLRAALPKDAGAENRLVDACQAANRAIWRHTGDGAGDDADAEPTMGATLTAVAWTGAALGVVHVGDSRAYLLRGRTLRRLTEDHTLVAALVRAGQLTEEAARRHPQRALLTRALGAGPDVEPFSASATFAPGDRLLLCTDGVTSVLDDGQLAAALRDPGPPGDVATALIRLALAQGGQDDTSAVVIEATAEAAEAAEATTEAAADDPR